jgi:hypothetical protein
MHLHRPTALCFRLRFILLAAAVSLPASTAVATFVVAVTGTSATGRVVSFTADLTLTGDDLFIQLANVSPDASEAAADVLSSFYFDIRRGTARPALVLAEAGGFVHRVLSGLPDQPEFYTPQTFVNAAGVPSDLVARAAGDATWQFQEMTAEKQPFLGFGVGTVGNSGVAPNSFNPHVVGPPGRHMINFAIYAGSDIDPVGVLDGSHLVRGGILFHFLGANGFGEGDLVDLFAFGMGTGPDSMLTVSMPEPSGVAMVVAAGLAGMISVALRRPARGPLHATRVGRSARRCRW